MDTINVNPVVSQQIFQIFTKASRKPECRDRLRGRVQSMENGLLLIRLLDGSSLLQYP